MRTSPSSATWPATTTPASSTPKSKAPLASEHVARLTVDLDALAHNYRVLGEQAAGATVAPVVKADGYGLGAVLVARRRWAEGARSFFVPRLAGGEGLRAGLGADRPAACAVP